MRHQIADMLIRIITLIAVLFTFSNTHAQTQKLAGTVSNSKNEPVPGATVTLTPGGGTTTDMEGGFTLNLVPGTTYELTISAIGYNTKTLSDVAVKPGEVNEVKVALDVAAKDLSGVTVVATRSSARRVGGGNPAM